MMENNPRFRSRKRYCCYYCNTYFYQVDAWQRHNRKHTGVEIECDDCGEMFSDHIDLKSHQPICDAHHVYSENVYTQNSDALCAQNPVNQITVKEHETPDSTSKQDSVNIDEIGEKSPSLSNKQDAILDELDDSNEILESKSGAEFEDLIGEVKDSNESNQLVEEDDPDTEAMIGVDHSGVIDDNNNNNDDNNKTNGEQYIKEENDSRTSLNENEPSENLKPLQLLDTTKSNSLKSSLVASQAEFANVNRVSPVPGSNVENIHNIVLDHSDLNKKYQPYFCKNCGARFTRKDSVTRHLKKGTCSGKSAIVCNICGKIFPDITELQMHFKLEHKNVVFSPPNVQRIILPRTEAHETARFPPYYVAVPEQHLSTVSHSYVPPDQQYRPMPPGLQAMFYGNQNHTHRPNASYSQTSNHVRDQYFHGKPIKVKFPSNSAVKNEHIFLNNQSKNITHYNEESHAQRKREYHDSEESVYSIKSRKIDMEHPTGIYRHDKSSFNKNINLSEYTNNAMSSKQYYDSRFSSKGNVTHRQHRSKDESHAHRCKVCGLEFPRFEYLLTHLRKHKEKLEVDRVDHHDDSKLHVKLKPIESQHSPSPHLSNPVQYPTHEQFNHQSLNDSNSSSSTEDVIDNKISFSSSLINHDSNNTQPANNHHVSIVRHDQTPIVVPPSAPPLSFNQNNNNGESYTSHQEQLSMLTQQQNKPHQDTFDAVGAGIDGKFRPFVCENCGQRFTRKDSLVRHAKKQTCFEEIVDLKCKHCDKTFRYNKCLIQHQELVHGISPLLQAKEPSTNPSDDEDSLSDKSEPLNADSQKASRHLAERDALHDSTRALQPTMSPYNEEARHSEHHGNGEMESLRRKHSYGYLTQQPSNPSNQHQFQHQKHSLFDQNQHALPKFIPPKEKKPEKHKYTEHSSQQHDSPYIGYSMLQPRPFQCEYCGDRFAHRHSLKRHVRRHLGIGIPCHDCGKLYRDQSEWRRHQLNIHNRRYEKYEVPSRMSFRDGVDQGLIRVRSNTNESFRSQHEESDSDRSDEEISMARSSTEFTQVATTISSLSSCVTPMTMATTTVSSDLNEPEQIKDHDDVKKAEEEKADEKELRMKMFDFKSHFKNNDKDSRKSVLDSYLCSPAEGDEIANRNGDNLNTQI